MTTRLCAAALAAAVWFLPAVADAACPAWVYVTGTTGANTLSSKADKPTRMKGLGGLDAFRIVDNPEFFDIEGCDPRDHWVEILDFRPGEKLNPPGSVTSIRLGNCQVLSGGGNGQYVWWGKNFVILRGCPVDRASDIRVVQ